MASSETPPKIPDGYYYVQCPICKTFAFSPPDLTGRVSFQHFSVFPGHYGATSGDGPVNLELYVRAGYREIPPEDFNKRLKLVP